MPTKKKSWSEKLHDNKDFPRVEKITEKMSKRWGTGTIVISAPIEVDELMRKIPKGKHLQVTNYQQHLTNIQRTYEPLKTNE